jgi:hypothetical protein
MLDSLGSTGVGEEGRLGLDVLCIMLCENAATFQGFWMTRVSAFALSTMFRLGQFTPPTVDAKGDIIITVSTPGNSGCPTL